MFMLPSNLQLFCPDHMLCKMMTLINSLTMLCVRTFLVMALPNVTRFLWFRKEGTKGYLVVWRQNEYLPIFLLSRPVW